MFSEDKKLITESIKRLKKQDKYKEIINVYNKRKNEEMKKAWACDNKPLKIR